MFIKNVKRRVRQLDTTFIGGIMQIAFTDHFK